VTLAFDYQRIFYDEVAAISNSNDNDLTPCFSPGPKPPFCLGGDDGLGFGWESMDVFKVGVRYDHDEKLSLMGGVSYNTDFASGRQALFNILAPATIPLALDLGRILPLHGSRRVRVGLLLHARGGAERDEPQHHASPERVNLHGADGYPNRLESSVLRS
jgi:hypothetical protein